MLIPTKLYVPVSRPDLIRRERLLARLDEGLTRRLTLVSARAGSGKTTLVSSWVRHLQESPRHEPQSATSDLALPTIAWLSLDDGDNDPGRFFTYFAAALREAGNDVALDLSQHDSQASVASLVTSLINELLPQEHRIILILDDYHLITASAVHHAISLLLEQLPPCLHLVLVTRADPPLQLARHRARGQMQEIRDEDLRFTLAETTAFLGRALEMSLTRADVAELERRTEGWIAGLQLAALSLGRCRDAATFIAGFSGRHPDVLDYLVQEVLERQPSHVQEFLLQTSLLPRLNPALCNAVTGRDDAHALLHELYRANLFLVPLDDEHIWFRYHHLFAQALHNRLRASQSTRDAQEMSESTLHRRAADWFAGEAMAEEAVQHALSAGDFAAAADLISRFGEATWTDNRAATLHKWIEALPEDVVCSRPYLGLLRAWTLWLTSRWYAVAPALAKAEASLQETPAPENDPPRAVLQGIAAAIRANLDLHDGEPTRAVRHAQDALNTLPAERFVWRGIVAQTLGDSYRALHDWQAATHSYTEALAIGQATQNFYTTLSAVRSRAELFQLQGRLRLAEAGYRHALQLAEAANGGRSTAAANVHIWLGRLLCEWHDLEEAQRHLEEGIGICQPQEYGVGLIMGHAELAQLHHLRGDVTMAWDSLHEAQKLARIYPLGNMLAYVQRVEAQFHLAQTRDCDDVQALQALAQWVQRCGFTPTTPFEKPGQAAVLYAHSLLIQEQATLALKVLARLQARAQSLGQDGLLVRLLALEALALAKEGRTKLVGRPLRQAIDLAAPERMVGPFLAAGAALAPHLEQGREMDLKPPTVAFVGRVQAILSADAARQRAGNKDASISLTNRESDLIPLLAAGLTNRQIAEQMVVAESTVKSHLGNIYRKLSVDNRTQAVARLRDLNLI